MDKKKVWVLHYDEGDAKVCTTECSAYRQILRDYVGLLADDRARIKANHSHEDEPLIDSIYSDIISDLKSLAHEHFIDGFVYAEEAECID